MYCHIPNLIAYLVGILVGFAVCLIMVGKTIKKAKKNK